jgi:hypothetical protein
LKPGEQVFEATDNSKNYTMKYIGVTFDEIGVLSKQVPLEPEPKIERIAYKAPMPRNRKSKRKKNQLIADTEKAIINVPAEPVQQMKIINKKIPHPIQIKSIFIEELKSPLHSRVTIPSENDIGSPKIINFECDMLSNSKLQYFNI